MYICMNLVYQPHILLWTAHRLVILFLMKWFTDRWISEETPARYYQRSLTISSSFSFPEPTMNLPLVLGLDAWVFSLHLQTCVTHAQHQISIEETVSNQWLSPYGSWMTHQISVMHSSGKFSSSWNSCRPLADLHFKKEFLFLKTIFSYRRLIIFWQQ